MRRTTAAAATGGLVTALVVASPSLRLAYRNPQAHLVLETVVATIGGLLALLLYGRFSRSRALHELLLVRGLTLLAVAALFFGAVPLVAGAATDSAIATWAPLLVRLAGAVALLAAALAPSRRVTRRPRPLREALLLTGLLLVLAVATRQVAAHLPIAVTALPPPELSARPVVQGHPVVQAAQVVNLLCYAVAAVAFTRRARRDGDDLLTWVAAAAALGVWARVNYLLFPSLYSDWLYVGDVLRLGFYLLLLTGAVRELRTYWSTRVEAAASAERRRLARDLHDGAVQELGYIRRLATGAPLDGETSARIRAAAERALDETRHAVTSLTSPVDEPVGSAVARAAREVGQRHDVPVTVEDRWSGGRLPGEHREALVRIAREAVSNAARHGAPSAVTVTVAPGELTVVDDGTGFTAATAGSRTEAQGGFGLTSMRDRAEGVGARFDVETAPGAGTAVRVRW